MAVVQCVGIGSGALTCSGSRAGGSGLWLVSAGGSSIVVVLAAPEMSACRCWIAVSLSLSAFCLPSIASFNCCVALTMRLVFDITGIGKVWCKNLNVSVNLTAPVSVTALMKR